MIIDCCICLEPTNIHKHTNFYRPKGSNDALLKCKHAFHKKCIKTWIVSGNNGTTCPCCRQAIKLKESYTYLCFVMLYPLKRAFQNIYSYSDVCQDKYIYFDNPSIILFLKNIMINCIHYCVYAIRFLTVKYLNMS